MLESKPPESDALFDLALIDRELRQEEAYARVGHTARTLVHEADLRIVLIVMRGGGHIRQHQARDTISIHVLSGLVRVGLPNGTADVPAGRLLTLQRDVPHDVEALEDSAFLLTLGWREQG